MLAAIHKAKDNSMKAILSEPELFTQFIKDYTQLDILKDVKPEDIEDMTERLLSLLTEQKDADTIKRINLKDDNSLYVIIVVEHQSGVNFRAPFKMLLYITLILESLEKEINKKASKEAGKDVNVTQRKDFKYPPILPLIFYDGESEWTAETNFLNRTEMSGIFEKYIPKFEYELISLNDYSFEDLSKFGNLLSLLMILNKVKKAENFNILNKLPPDYAKLIDTLHVPAHLKDLVIRSVAALLTKINAPQDEIDDIIDKIDKKGVSQVMSLEDYDVQAFRIEARAEARAEVRAEARAEARAEMAAEVEKKMRALIKALIGQGFSIKAIADTMESTEQEVTRLSLA